LIIDFRITEEEALRAIEVFRNTQEHELAARIERELEAEREDRAARQRAADAEEARRAERAENAVLTPRQADALAACRAGKGPRYRWVGGWRGWDYTSNMGGAVNRMIGVLVEEGLISSGNWKITPGGLARLEAWEAKHGKVDEPEKVQN